VASKKETSPSTAPSSTERIRSSGTGLRSIEATARRGRVRDALAALGNVESMLRSRSADGIGAEVEELRRGMHALHEAFEAAVLESSDAQRAALSALSAFAADRIRAVEATLRDPSVPGVAASLGAVALDLDTAAGLLELAERAAEFAPVEVSVATLAEQALHLAWSLRSHSAVSVRVRSAIGDCSVSCDPHVVARVLAIAVAIVRETSSEVLVTTQVEEGFGVIEISAAKTTDDAARVMQTRILPRIGPTDAVLATASLAAGIALDIEPGRILLRCPRVVS
jgi:hypothetical protein